MNFTKKQITEITGLTPRLIQFYTEEGLVLPEKDSGQGRGNVRRFSRRSLLDFLIIAELVTYNITKKRIGRILTYLKQNQYVNDCFEHNFFRKGSSLYGRIYTEKSTGKFIIDISLVFSGDVAAKVLSFEEFQKMNSMLIIDIGKLTAKAINTG